MRRRLAALAAALGLAVIALGSAEAKVDGPIVASYGSWDVHRTAEAMTGKTQCIATYRGRDRVELYRDKLILLTSGWRNPYGYRFRIDELPVSRWVGASELTRLTRTVAFGGDLFNQLLKAHRLRIEVLNKHDVREFDLDLNGIYNAYGALYYCR